MSCGAKPSRVANPVGDPAIASALIALACGRGRQLWTKSRPWASASFSGSRQEVALEFLGADAACAGEEMLAQLFDAELSLPGYFVADVRIGFHSKTGTRTVAVVELLLLVED